ncbi:MAG: L,D-transpeptidase family protein [Bdellovibrionales bacterium]
MNSPRFGNVLALSSALVVFQFVTQTRCFAAEVSKTVEPGDPPAALPESGQLPSALLSLNADNGFFSRYAFLVDKKSRTLTVWENDGDKIKAVAAFPADLGAKPGDKQREGDLKTPEGIYFIQSSLDGNKVDPEKYGEKIFTLDYPNSFDKLEKKTGKGIWLHAIPDKKSLQRGSHGCVVVRNKSIEDLAKYIELKRTPLIVTEQVEYLSEREWLRAQKKLKTLLETWRAKRLGELGSSSEINLHQLQIFNAGRKIVVRFLETEKSELKDEVGTKVLYALRAETGLEVVSENWQPL